MNEGGIGLAGILGVVFLVLKLTGFIDWSWWLVLLPFWIGAAIWLFLIVIFFLALFVTPTRMRHRR